MKLSVARHDLGRIRTQDLDALEQTPLVRSVRAARNDYPDRVARLNGRMKPSVVRIPIEVQWPELRIVIPVCLPVREVVGHCPTPVRSSNNTAVSPATPSMRRKRRRSAFVLNAVLARSHSHRTPASTRTSANRR